MTIKFQWIREIQIYLISSSSESIFLSIHITNNLNFREEIIFAKEINSEKINSNSKDTSNIKNYNISLKYLSSSFPNNNSNYSTLNLMINQDLIFDLNLENSIEYYIGSEEAYYGLTASFKKNNTPNIKFVNPKLFVSKNIINLLIF